MEEWTNIWPMANGNGMEWTWNIRRNEMDRNNGPNGLDKHGMKGRRNGMESGGGFCTLTWCTRSVLALFAATTFKIHRPCGYSGSPVTWYSLRMRNRHRSLPLLFLHPAALLYRLKRTSETISVRCWLNTSSTHWYQSLRHSFSPSWSLMLLSSICVLHGSHGACGDVAWPVTKEVFGPVTDSSP